MEFRRNIAAKPLEGLLLMAMIFSTSAVAGSSDTAAEFIDQAHKYDNMYTLGPEVSQQKALSFYESALGADGGVDRRIAE
jgi:hypothetical protein